MNIVVIGIILTLVCVIVINVENVNAQQNNNSTGIAKLNFTKILEGKAWRHYFTPNSYNPTLEVLYQGKKMLVLQSDYIDAIWKAVEIAKENGCTIDGLSNYASGSRIETLMAISK